MSGLLAHVKTARDELRKTLVLAVPITMGHLSQMILGFIDTLMIGRVGVVPLAAAAVGNAIGHALLIMGIGLLSSVSVFVAHAFGAGKSREAGEMLRHGVLLATVSGLLLAGLMVFSAPVLRLMGQPAEVVATAEPYLFYLGLSLPFALIGIAFKNYSEALDKPWPGLWSGILAAILNIFLNWIFIFGNLGAPAMGLEGAGLATFLSRVVQMLVLILWLRTLPAFRETWPEKWMVRFAWPTVQAMSLLGLPVALQLLMEVGAFAASTMLMGNIGVSELAAHQIVLTYAGTTFMIPLGISLAVAIRVGHVIGAGQRERARTIGFGAIGAGFVLSFLFATIFIAFNEPLIGIFTPDVLTLTIGAQLLIVAGIFQMFDGTQVLAVGALRGCKDVRVPTVIIFTAYWVLGIPLGAFLAFAMDFGAVGIWVGLAIGLGAASIGLNLRFARFSRP